MSKRETNRRTRALASIPALLLILVAATNRVAVATSDLSAWELGGFGMFSTIDAPDTRAVIATGTTASGREVDLTVPRSLGDAESRLRVWPTERRARHLAAALLAERWTVADGDDAAPSPSGQLLRGVHVTVSRIRFEGSTGTARYEVLVEVQER